MPSSRSDPPAAAPALPPEGETQPAQAAPAEPAGDGEHAELQRQGTKAGARGDSCVSNPMLDSINQPDATGAGNGSTPEERRFWFGDAVVGKFYFLDHYVTAPEDAAD